MQSIQSLCLVSGMLLVQLGCTHHPFLGKEDALKNQYYLSQETCLVDDTHAPCISCGFNHHIARNTLLTHGDRWKQAIDIMASPSHTLQDLRQVMREGKLPAGFSQEGLGACKLQDMAYCYKHAPYMHCFDTQFNDLIQPWSQEVNKDDRLSPFVWAVQHNRLDELACLMECAELPLCMHFDPRKGIFGKEMHALLVSINLYCDLLSHALVMDDVNQEILDYLLDQLCLLDSNHDGLKLSNIGWYLDQYAYGTHIGSAFEWLSSLVVVPLAKIGHIQAIERWYVQCEKHANFQKITGCEQAYMSQMRRLLQEGCYLSFLSRVGLSYYPHGGSNAFLACMKAWVEEGIGAPNTQCPIKWDLHAHAKDATDALDFLIQTSLWEIYRYFMVNDDAEYASMLSGADNGLHVHLALIEFLVGKGALPSPSSYNLVVGYADGYMTQVLPNTWKNLSPCEKLKWDLLPPNVIYQAHARRCKAGNRFAMVSPAYELLCKILGIKLRNRPVGGGGQHRPEHGP